MHAGRREHADRLAPLDRRAIFVAVAIVERMVGIVELDPPDVGDVRLVGRERPAQVIVVSQDHHRAAVGRGAAEIPAAGAADVGLEQLGKPEPGQMWIDQQQGIPRVRLGRRDRPAVGAAGGPDAIVGPRQVRVRQPGAAEAQLQRDVPAIGQHVPGLEVLDQPRPRVAVRGQVMIQPGGKRGAERSQLGIEHRIHRLGPGHDLERPIEQVRVQPSRAVHLGIPPHGQDVVVFDLPEEVFGLGIGKAEQRGLVVLPVDVRRAEGVAIDRDFAGQPPGQRTLCGQLGIVLGVVAVRGDGFVGVPRRGRGARPFRAAAGSHEAGPGRSPTALRWRVGRRNEPARRRPAASRPQLCKWPSMRSRASRQPLRESPSRSIMTRRPAGDSEKRASKLSLFMDPAAFCAAGPDQRDGRQLKALAACCVRPSNGPGRLSPASHLARRRPWLPGFAGLTLALPILYSDASPARTTSAGDDSSSKLGRTR